MIYLYTEYLWSCIVNRNRLLGERCANDKNSLEESENDFEPDEVQNESEVNCSSSELLSVEDILLSDNLETDPDNGLDRFEFSELDEFEEAAYDFETKKITFYPPVYIQRYVTVVNVLKDERWKEEIKKVGCFKSFNM